MKEKIITSLLLIFCMLFIYLIGKPKTIEPKKEEVKIEFNETKIKEKMKLFPAPKGWVLIYNDSLVYVPDEDHIWELAKKGSK